MSFKAGFVGIIGQPNAGKSTLLNSLVQEKLAIVSPKPQTTRRRVVGVVSQKSAQFVFVDAPGILTAAKGLNAFLQQEALDVIDQSDVVLCVLNVDAASSDEVKEIIELAEKSYKPWGVVISKVDKANIAGRAQKIRDMLDGRKNLKFIHEISNRWGKENAVWRNNLLQELAALLPESAKPLYDIDLYTPHSIRDLAAEVVREKCFDRLNQEVPYNLAVRVNKVDEETPGLVKMYMSIVVARDSYKPIVVGQNGKTIKEIGTAARKEIEALVASKVFLGLEVVVREDWFTNQAIMKEFGYVIEKRK